MELEVALREGYNLNRQNVGRVFQTEKILGKILVARISFYSPVTTTSQH